MAVTSGGTAQPVAFLNNWSISFSVGKIDVTSFGDTGMVYVSGLPDASGDYAGFFDNATPQMLTAAQDGQPRSTYIYPDLNTASQYFSGTALFDMNIDGTVDGAVTINGSWAAAGPWTKTG